MKLSSFVKDWNRMIDATVPFSDRPLSSKDLEFLEKTLSSLQMDKLDAYYDLEIDNEGKIVETDKKKLDKMKPVYYNKTKEK